MNDEFKMQVLALRTRAAMLDGQEQAAARELSKLRGIACPECNGKRQFEEQGINSTVNFTQCDLCEGTGLALGKLYSQW